MTEPSAQKLPRQVWLLGGVSFFADVSGEMIYPLLPLFVVAALGASATELGWIEGAAQGIVALLAAWAGARSDRFRKRLPWIRWGYALPVAGKAILAIATGWPLVLLGRTVDRFGKGLRGGAKDALLADATPVALRGRAYGLDRALDTAGALVGVLAAAGLLWWLSGTPSGGHPATAVRDPHPYRVVFAIAAALGVAALALTLVVRDVPREQHQAEHEHEHEHEHEPAKAGRFELPRAYWLVLAMLVAFALANSSDTFLLLRAAQVGLSPWEVVLAYAAYNVVYAAASYPAGALSDRHGRWIVIGAGWAIYALVYAGFALGGSSAMWPLFMIYGLYMALTDGVGKALIADHAPKQHRGRALGMFQLAQGASLIASSVLAGALWDHVGPSAPFWFGAAAAVVALAVLVLARRRRPRDS